MRPADRSAALAGEKYISLTTFRRDGRAVATPVWFAQEGALLFVWTGADSGKVKRIRNNPEVTVAPCDGRGKVKGPAFTATARIMPAADAARAQRLLDRKYGFVKRALGLANTVLRIVRRRPKTAPAYLEITPL